VKNCLLSFISDWMVGKLVAPANANIVVLKADNVCSSTLLSVYDKLVFNERSGELNSDDI
jgi:hypothetical protein